MSPSTSISVVIVTRDRPRLLADALASVASQTVTPLEVRVADDGQIPIAGALDGAGLLEVTLVPSDAGQPAGARNRAARGAQGEVLALLDDDDLWLPAHLAGLAEIFADPQVAFAYRDSVVVRERLGPDGRRLEIERCPITRDWELERVRRDDYVPPSAWAVRRALFERLNGFDEGFRYSEDWDFLLRAASLTVPRRVPGITAEVRLRGLGNLSENRGVARRDCLERLARRHGMPVPDVKTFWDVALELSRES